MLKFPIFPFLSPYTHTTTTTYQVDTFFKGTLNIHCYREWYVTPFPIATTMIITMP
ncbi:hypothetical protein NTG1052_410045 [Candidatus Nitrotoga sp. 1052]|nr:hypothetical protein NTG1052_410045 [Candidatus Nitrotoga sp. 1052]